jgi:mycothiol system anti-sigma-R factor
MTLQANTLDISCTTAEEQLQAYYDGMLDGATVIAIEAHLQLCTPCARAYAFERKFRSYVKSCCGGGEAEGRCRDEFRRKLESCRQATREQPG